MRSLPFTSRTLIASTCTGALLLSTCCSGSFASPARDRVGTVALENTGKPEAQQDFLDGLAALHSFWYEEARTLFRAAQASDPGFALAYWGEAMTYYQPIWRSTDNSAGQTALDHLDDRAGERLARYGTAVEQLLVEAARELFGDGGQQGFSDTLAAGHERFPDSTEIAVFYALSLQGRAGGWGKRSAEDELLLAESAQILEQLFERHPRHPGVLHYLIHALDDPAHAARALDAARIYSTVAPDASHALHMPSHIYVQVGDWDGVVASNRAAWTASERWVEREGLPDSKKDFHALSWLHYGLLQSGDFEAADEVLAVLRANGGGRWNSEPVWQARRLVESEDWEMELSDSSGEEMRFARAYAAARRGDLDEARKEVDSLNGSSGDGEILRLEIEGLIAAGEGKSMRAAELLADAGRLEEASRAPSGPPDLVKPALELYGEMLLEMGYCEEAVKAFDRSLARMPNRRLSLRGAQAAAACASS